MEKDGAGMAVLEGWGVLFSAFSRNTASGWVSSAGDVFYVWVSSVGSKGDRCWIINRSSSKHLVKPVLADDIQQTHFRFLPTLSTQQWSTRTVFSNPSQDSQSLQTWNERLWILSDRSEVDQVLEYSTAWLTMSSVCLVACFGHWG